VVLIADSPVVEVMLTTMMARKVRTPEELEAVMKEPLNVSPTREVFCGGAQ
jgi:hypothetical protein